MPAPKNHNHAAEAFGSMVQESEMKKHSPLIQFTHRGLYQGGLLLTKNTIPLPYQHFLDLFPILALRNQERTKESRPPGPEPGGSDRVPASLSKGVLCGPGGKCFSRDIQRCEINPCGTGSSGANEKAPGALCLMYRGR